MSGEHISNSNDATLGNGAPAIVTIAFEMVVSVTGAVFYDVGLQLPPFALFSFSDWQRCYCKQIV